MKGILQSLEAMIGILTILTVFIVVFAPQAQLPEFDTINWKLRGFSALKTLDDANELRSGVLANDTTAINNKLLSLLPVYLNYNVTICELNCTKPSSIDSEKLVSINYLIAGDVGNVTFRQIVLYLW